MTIQSAYALFRDEEVGSLEPGKYADLIVISGNPLILPSEELRRLDVLVTMVGGRFEYCGPREPGLCPGYQARTPLPLPDFRPAVPIRWIVLVGMPLLPLIVGFWLVRQSDQKWLARLFGFSGIIGGGLWVWVWANSLSYVRLIDLVMWPLITSGILLAIATVGSAIGERLSRLGWIGLGMAWVGILTLAESFLLTSWFSLEAAWPFIWVGLLGHAIGLIILGMANVRARRLKPLNLLPLVIGLLGVLLPFALSFMASRI